MIIKRECDYEEIQSVLQNAINTARFTTLIRFKASKMLKDVCEFNRISCC